MKTNNIIPTARKNDLVIQEMPDEVLVYDLLTNRASCLNQTAAIVWQNCDGEKNVSEITGTLMNEFNLDVKEEIVVLALDQLKRTSLLEEFQELPETLESVSRREMIKKVGMTSMIALPLITTLIAPPAIYAQSCTMNAPGCLPNGNAGCVSSTQCCSCTCRNNGNCVT